MAVRGRSYADVVAENLPRIRRAPIPQDAVIVVRGQPADPAEARFLAEDFRDRFPGWGRWGVSAFYARGEVEVDDLASTRLRRFRLVRVYRVADLVGAGFEIVPTFRTPHVTIAWRDELDEGLERLDSADHIERLNPYHGSESEDTP